MEMITTRAPTVRAHVPVVPDRFSATNYATAAAQDRLREAMMKSVPPELRAKADTGPKRKPSKMAAEQLAEAKRRGKTNRSRILAALEIRNRSRDAIEAELGLTRNEMKTAMDVLYRYAFVVRAGTAPLLSGGGGASAILAITAAGRAALAEGRV